MQKKAIKKGFTLIELLIVIAIIAIIAAVAFVALDPLRRFQDARDAQRWTDITAILSAAKIDQIDNGGTYNAAITAMTNGTRYQIGDDNTGCDAGVCATPVEDDNCVDIDELVTDGYLASIPTDPSNGTDGKTLYYIEKSSTGNLTVGACDPEGGNSIEVAR